MSQKHYNVSFIVAKALDHKYTCWDYKTFSSITCNERATEAKVTEFWHFQHNKKKFSVMVTIASQLCWSAILSLLRVNLWAVQSVPLWNVTQGPNLRFAFTWSLCV
jgi:hypothetical protein